MSEVRNWLEGIGLGQYAEAFEVNEIDMDLLRQVDDQMLKDIDISTAGHRLRFRNAITKLEPTPSEANASRLIVASKDAAVAERRQLTVMFCDLQRFPTYSNRELWTGIPKRLRMSESSPIDSVFGAGAGRCRGLILRICVVASSKPFKAVRRGEKQPNALK